MKPSERILELESKANQGILAFYSIKPGSFEESETLAPYAMQVRCNALIDSKTQTAPT
jgi:hypothetical protein